MNAYGVTFAIYRLVFQIFGATTSPKGGDLRHSGPLGDVTCRIWPNPSCEINPLPKLVRFDDVGLAAFANIFVPPTD